MMTRLTAATALLALTACGTIQMPDLRQSRDPGRIAPAAVAPAPAPAPTPLTAKERLVAAIESNGCVLNAGNVGAVLEEATIGQQELLQLAPQLEAEGRASVAGDGAIRVNTAACTA